MKNGFIKCACITADIKVADCAHNASQITALSKEAAALGVSLAVFPELCITAYTCGDLFLQQKLLSEAVKALSYIAAETASLDMLIIVGLPIAKGAALYNCAAVLLHGEILGIVPKKNIPNYSEFYEARHFTPADAAGEISIGGKSVPFGCDLLFCCRSMPEFCIGIEICEDLWVANPPSSRLTEGGATIIANLSASDEIISKAEFRRALVASQSARTVSAYLYADAGFGESTTDLVFAGHNLIYENGARLSESKRFTTGIITADVDVFKLCSERRRMTTYKSISDGFRTVEFDIPIKETALTRRFPKTPFVPSAADDLNERCEEILALQSTGLATRLRHTNCKSAVIGLSGGLDSTLALIATVHAFDMLLLDRSGIAAVTMPCFGTTSRTYKNAVALAKAYGATLYEIDIKDAVLQHFKDIGQDSECHDVTYENSQARERTQVLMDLSNKLGGIVVGTGDLSELALGWATYNGDHMSMYAVNASIPKTLVRYITAYEAATADEPLKSILLDILDTPVSPELLPPDRNKISQKTEEIVGPYELHDFFLYYMVRFGFSPEKIFRLALIAFDGEYSRDTIKKWLITFLRRFFAQQFKRSCLPDGPMVGSVTLSPRGDFRAPSDASAAAWLEEAEGL